MPLRNKKAKRQEEQDAGQSVSLTMYVRMYVDQHTAPRLPSLRFSVFFSDTDEFFFAVGYGSSVAECTTLLLLHPTHALYFSPIEASRSSSRWYTMTQLV